MDRVTWTHNGEEIAIARHSPQRGRFDFVVKSELGDYEGWSPSIEKAIDSVRILLQIYCGLKEERGQDEKTERKLIDK